MVFGLPEDLVEFVPGLLELGAGKTDEHRSQGAPKDDDHGSDLQDHAHGAAFQEIAADDGHTRQEQSENCGFIHIEEIACD